MIYTATDIIKKAKMAADLQNSDFISWYEEVSLLNDAYTSLYQKLINIGDMSFVCRIDAEDGMTLPSDFWQLKNLYLDINGVVRVISRRAPSEGFNILSYEILDNTLHIYGNTTGRVVMEYFKAPCDIIPRPEPEEVLERFDCKKVFGSYKNFYICESEDSAFLEVLDITTGVKAETQDRVADVAVTENGAYKLICGTNGVVIKCKDKKVQSFNYYGERTTPENLNTGAGGVWTTLVRLSDGRVGFLGFHIDYSKVIIDGEIIGTAPKSILNEKYAISHTNPSLDYWICQDANSLDVYREDSDSFETVRLENYSNVVSYDSRVYNDTLFFLSNSKINSLSLDDVLNVTVGVKPHLVSAPLGKVVFSDFDFDTGMGFIEKTKSGFSKLPFVEETTLEFPNTFYYQMLSILLAIQFCIKQGKDISLLSAQLAEYEHTFHDTLARDAYSFTRIRNAY